MLKELIEPSINGTLSVIGKTGMGSLYCEKRPGVCILMYHGFTDVVEPPGLENLIGLHQNIDEFRKLARILSREYNVISLNQLVESERNGIELPPASVVLTFDDGYASNYELAYPILKEFDLHATIYVATAFVDEGQFLWPDRLEYALGNTKETELKLDFPGLPKTLDLSSKEAAGLSLKELDPAIKALSQESYLDAVAHVEDRCGFALASAKEVPSIYRPLSWSQIREMNESPYVSIGAHTHNHRILGRCDLDTVRQELEENLSLLKLKGAVNDPSFAYPNGQAADHNEGTRKILKEQGVDVALTTERGLNIDDLDLMTLERIASPPTAAQAAAVCSGLPFAIKKKVERILGRNLLF